MYQRNHIAAIFFDLDDTLCDYSGSVEAAFAAVFPVAAARHACLDYDRLRRDFDLVLERAIAHMGGVWAQGYTREDRFREALAEGGVDDPDLAALMATAYSWERLYHLQPFDDALPTLDALRPRYPLGLITNGPGTEQRAALQRLGMDDYFQVVVISGELRVYKPQQEIFQRALERMGCGAAEAVYVGNDPRLDVAGAKGVGMGAAWLNRNGGTLPADIPQPDLEIASLRELLPLLP
ncbi:MAG: HAD family hydrolase [Dehalococcoidia bacterium]